MTNNQLCDIIGCAGCGIAAWCMGMIFFGMTSAIWGVLIGLLLGVIGLVNYD